MNAACECPKSAVLRLVCGDIRTICQDRAKELTALRGLVPHLVALCSGDPLSHEFVDVRTAARAALSASGVLR